MRLALTFPASTFLASAFLALPLPSSAFAQSVTPLSADITSGLSSGFDSAITSGLSAGIESGLGADTRRTLADGYFKGDRNAGVLNGGTCVPTQITIDDTGCHPFEALANAINNPNRKITYYGNSAMGPANTMPTYIGDSAVRLQGGADPDRPF